MSEVNGARVDLATRRTLVMSVRYALRISVDDATEETPSAAYRSGSPESVESGAAGIVAGVSAKEERSRQRRANDAPTKGERTRRAVCGSVADGGRRVESRSWSRSRCGASRAVRASK